MAPSHELSNQGRGDSLTTLQCVNCDQPDVPDGSGGIWLRLIQTGGPHCADAAIRVGHQELAAHKFILIPEPCTDGGVE